LTIAAADRTTFRDVKIVGGGQILFTGAALTLKVAFVNVSVEGTGFTGIPSCAVDFGTGAFPPSKVLFTGGEIALTPTAFCNASLAFTNGTASLTGTYVDSTNLFGTLPTVSPFVYTIGSIINNCGGYQTFDSFVGGSGTVLSNHIDNCFHGWSQWASGPDSSANHITLDGAGNAVYVGVTNNASYYDLLIPSSANYTVSFNCTSTSSGSTGTICAALGRISTSAATAYEALNISGTCQLYSLVAGSLTQIGSNVSCAWNAGITHRLGLSMQGTTITLLIDGAATAAAGTDSSISATGFGGIRINDNSASVASQFSIQ